MYSLNVIRAVPLENVLELVTITSVSPSGDREEGREKWRGEEEDEKRSRREKEDDAVEGR
jgi:hypothetical protein